MHAVALGLHFSRDKQKPCTATTTMSLLMLYIVHGDCAASCQYMRQNAFREALTEINGPMIYQNCCYSWLHWEHTTLHCRCISKRWHSHVRQKCSWVNVHPNKGAYSCSTARLHVRKVASQSQQPHLESSGMSSSAVLNEGLL